MARGEAPEQTRDTPGIQTIASYDCQSGNSQTHHSCLAYEHFYDISPEHSSGTTIEKPRKLKRVARQPLPIYLHFRYYLVMSSVVIKNDFDGKVSQ